MSPSFITYSLPSLRNRPFALAFAIVPQAYWEVENLAWMQCSGNPSAGYYFAHCIPDFEKVLKKGICGILEDVDRRLAELDPLDLGE